MPLKKKHYLWKNITHKVNTPQNHNFAICFVWGLKCGILYSIVDLEMSAQEKIIDDAVRPIGQKYQRKRNTDK